MNHTLTVIASPKPSRLRREQEAQIAKFKRLLQRAGKADDPRLQEALQEALDRQEIDRETWELEASFLYAMLLEATQPTPPGRSDAPLPPELCFRASANAANEW